VSRAKDYSYKQQLRDEPEFVYQAMGAGVQSTTIALLAAEGVIPKPRFAVFSDTGWESQKVYDHLDKLDREVLAPSGISLVRVRKSNIRQDVSSPHSPDLIPLYIKNSKTGRNGITRRQCTSVYKIHPINRWVREQLGATVKTVVCKYCNGKGQRATPWLVTAGEQDFHGRCFPCEGSGTRRLVGHVRDRGAWVVSYIGFSVDEIERVSASRERYVVNSFPLLDLGMSRDDCYDYLGDRGWGETVKSACIGCPFHSNAEWRKIKADPVQWADVVEVDASIRHLPGRDSIGFLHGSRVPLEIADISTGGDEELGSCSPFGCRSEDTNLLPAVDADVLF
jgi:hypothetical protein